MEGDAAQSPPINHGGSVITEEKPLAAASFIHIQIPEPVKLLAASFLVAIVIHHFFRGKKKKRPSSFRVLHATTRASGEILGSADPLTETNATNEDGDAIISPSEEAPSNHSSLSQTKRLESKVKVKKKKKVKPSKLASETRNYDKLICEKPVAPMKDDDVEPPSTAKDTTKSSLEQDASSLSSPTTVIEAQIQQKSPHPIQLHSQAQHPGLSAYYNWHSTITSLYRIYSVPSRDIFNNNNNNTIFHPAILPMHPSSERGNVAINITVINQTKYPSIDVYWIDYKGREVYKGTMTRGGSWVQTTYIGHPWTFRIGGGEEEEEEEEGVLLKYVPFRIVPSVVGAETIERATSSSSSSRESSSLVGTQTFTLRDVPEGYVTRNEGYEPVCWVDDLLLPEAPLLDTYNNGERNLTLFTMHEMQLAIQWSCLQLQREDVVSPGTGIAAAKRLLQYLQNVCLHPEKSKYRKLRIANRIFFESVYSTGARGVLLALGFEEHAGFLECGPSEGAALNYERLRQISDAMMMVDKTLKLMVESEGGMPQPEGSDGYGRAGFGHAGQMNL